MAIDFTNTNLVWTSILAETLHLLGVKTAIICPGSRSAPLAVAFANHAEIEAIPALDERSAAFFALGIARQSKQPVVLICTSGTAGANFYPAIIEARESRVPLLVLTADRPPELRDCNAGQAIDQQKLYGSYPNWQTELALPSLEISLLHYLRQTTIHAWERSLYPEPGPVHLNLPFRDPLAPIPQPEAQSLAESLDLTDFFASLTSSSPLPAPPLFDKSKALRYLTSPASLPPPLPLPEHGLIIAGPAQPVLPDQYCRAIAHLSKSLGYPVLAEGISPLRNYVNLNLNLISTYDLILRNPIVADKLVPEIVIRIGEMPTSKQLRTWLTTTQPPQLIVDPDGRNLDPLHGKTTHLRLTVEAFAHSIPRHTKPSTAYLDRWRMAEAQARRMLDKTMAETEFLFECKVAWLLSKVLPAGTPLFISSSMPVRDVEFFWSPNNFKIKPFFNRGANGIDGSLSTALGIAHRQQSSVMLTGDLALLHDTNGFLLRSQFAGHLTIVLIDNNGGGIFEMLPISQFEPPFETFFATPQSVNFAQLCTTYGIEHELITSWQQLERRLKHLPDKGIRVLEIRTGRKADALWRQNNLEAFAANINIDL